MRVVKSWNEHQARVAHLRALGYRVKIITLPNGDRVVLKSKKPFVCSSSFCTTAKDKPVRKKKRRAA
jgi:hypothetical protein